VAEVASAYVALIPSFKGGARAIGKELDGPVNKTAQASGKSSGAAYGKSFGSSAGGVLKAALGAALITGGFVAAKQFIGDSIGEAREAQKVGAITEQIIKSTGGAAKITAAQVGSLATAISLKTGVDDEAIQAGANLLLTFKNVRNEVGQGNAVFDRATQAASDLAAAGFGDLSSSSKQLGKALNDPIKGMTALARSGVTFTAAQKKQVAALVESGDILSAQKIILGEVESQVGGTAAASATASEKMAVGWGNLKETVGTLLLPVLDKLSTKLTGVFSWISTTGVPAIKRFAATFKEEVIPRLIEFGGWVNKNKDWLITAGIAIATFLAIVKGYIIFNAVTTAIKAYRAAGIAATLAQWGFNAALLANPIVLIIAAIAALVVGLVFFFTKTELGKKIITNVWAAIKTAVKAVADWFTGTLVPALGRVWDTIIAAVRVVGSIYAAIFRGIRDVALGVWEFLKKVFSWTPIGIIITNWDKILDWFGALPGKIASAASGMWDGIVSAFRGAINSVIRLWNNLSFTIGGGSFMGVDIPEVRLDTPNIPYLAAGGIVDRPTLAMIGEGREPEAVLPLSKLRDMLNQRPGAGDGGPVDLSASSIAALIEAAHIVAGGAVHQSSRATALDARRQGLGRLS
jgi:hypothetical protein